MRRMPRRDRCQFPGLPCHVTQRGVNRSETFYIRADWETYLRLVQTHQAEAGVEILGWCLMSNHVHWIVVGSRPDSLSVFFRRVHGRYAQYFNARWGRSGHLWQNRFFSCPLEGGHLSLALAYVDLNPVRAGLVASAGDYLWSSASAHIQGRDSTRLLNLDLWRQLAPPAWERVLTGHDREDAFAQLRSCTYAGRPYGTEDFVQTLGAQLGRYWRPGRPPRRPQPVLTSTPRARAAVSE